MWIGRVSGLHPNDYDEYMEGSQDIDLEDVKYHQAIASFDKKAVDDWIASKQKENDEYWEGREWDEERFEFDYTKLCEGDNPEYLP